MATIPTAVIKCPDSIARAMAIDTETGTTHWQDTLSEELKANKFQLVFYVEPDSLQCKVRLVRDDANKMDVDTPITTKAIHTDSEVPRLAAEAHLSTKTMAGPKEKSKKEMKQKSKPKPKKEKSNKDKSKDNPKKGKSNKGKVPKRKFNKQNPAAYVTAAVWKSMSKEEQQAARDGRRELDIKTRNDNLPTTLQLPDFGKADEVSSKGTTMDLCGISTPLPVKEKRRTRVLTQLELQQEQIMELKSQMQEFQRSNCQGYQ
jgi:hypothetical protein